MTQTAAIATLDAPDASSRRAARRLLKQIEGSTEFETRVREVLSGVSEGESFLVVRRDEEVTPAQAAELLGVTRQFVDRLLDDGQLAFRRLPGSRHRRIRVRDVIELREERDAMRAARELAASVLGDS